MLFFKGIKGLDAGTTQIAFSSILIWGAFLSVMFLGSVFSFMQVAGILLMLVSILVVQYTKGSLDLNSSFLYIAASAVYLLYSKLLVQTCHKQFLLEHIWFWLI